MKKLFAIVVLGLLWGSSVDAKDYTGKKLKCSKYLNNIFEICCKKTNKQKMRANI